MKLKNNLIKLMIVASVVILFLAFASACNINVKLLNQDPYPVIPGENVKVVFQVTDFSAPYLR